MIIRSSNFTSHHLILLREWFELTWGGKFDEFEALKMGMHLPSPVLALDDDKLVGGLSFTAYENPEENDIALWINALYVDSNMRGFGIGSKLISFAEHTAREAGFTKLYVNTNIPSLYLKKMGGQSLHRMVTILF